MRLGGLSGDMKKVGSCCIGSPAIPFCLTFDQPLGPTHHPHGLSASPSEARQSALKTEGRVVLIFSPPPGGSLEVVA